jgi:tetratricopeptide (TPR) repeat protein
MDAARKFVDKGQIDKAVKEYLRIVHEDPKDVRVWLKIGDLYAKKGAKQDAIETYLKVARFYHEQGFFLKAVAVYKQILKLDPRLVDVILKLAELYRQLGLMSDAMQHFESVAAHFHREGNTKEALATVKKLVDLDPENIATRIKLAELYSKEGLVDDAATEFTVACEQLRRQGRQDDFVKVAERLLWHKPDNLPLHRELAGLYLRRNDPRRALQKLQACFKADPRDVDTLGLLAQAFQALDQKAKTVSVLKELARIHIENKQRDKAGDVFRKIIEFVPNDPDATAFLGTSVGAARPPATAPATPAVPPVRAQTAMPAAVRAATSDARFNLTNDLPALTPASARMTGSMPLVDEEALSGGDFALPEYDDSDFSADMEPPPAQSSAGERHAEEISKILAETDVYVKYGLHQKAVDHLRRVFTLDPDNVEAHERLKDIFVSQGREQEAEAELLKLAEVVAPEDPDRAEAYLQELLAINGTHTGAFELARRFRLRVARMSSSASHEAHDYAIGGGVAAVEGDFEDLDLAPPRMGGPVARRAASRDSVDDFDPDELIGGGIAHGSPAPGRPPGRPAVAPNGAPRAPMGTFESEGFEIDFDSSPQQNTRQMSQEHVDSLNARSAQIEPHHNAGLDSGAAARIDAQLEDEELGDDIGVEVAAELAQGSHHDADDLPFDPDEARAFDAGVAGATEHAYRAPEEDLGVNGSYDPYGTEAAAPIYEDTSAHVVPTMRGGALGIDEIEEPPPALTRAESTNIEDELDEADFYAGQGMIPEALDVLHGLLERFPNHRLVLAKLRELEPVEHDVADHAIVHEQPSAEMAAVDEPHDLGTDAIELDDLEEVDPDALEEIDVDPIDRSSSQKRPAVMLEKPLDEGDADTHYDLGLAYKEMGLHDEAIKAFEKTLRAPGREVQCRVMIGMCQREMGNATEAIQQFKAGLHAEPSERERQSLHYEIGMTYESIGDDPEALYYFEKVAKRDASFADAAARAEHIRSRGSRPSRPETDDDL